MKSQYVKFAIKWMLVINSFFLVPAAWGTVKALNDDISELELETEVEDQELYDEYAMVKEEQKLNQDLKNEAQQLERKIKKLNSEKTQAAKKHEKLTHRRKLAEGVYDRVSDSAAKVEKERNQQFNKTSQLQAQVESLEAKSVNLRNTKIQQQKEIRSLKNKQRLLTQRLKKAQKIIDKHQKSINKLKSQKRELKKSLATTSKRVQQAEKQAIAKRAEVKRLR
ncbi:MAG: hypothetical protein KDD40_12385 [Bdellovibrionales bacterium]|nr:hypothetical protein [Bdellovibrionales bacterium]